MKKTTVLLVLLAFCGAILFAAGGTESTTTTTGAGAADTGAYKGAPWFAAAVANGTLPPVDERLPTEPMVVRPGDGNGFVENGTYTRGAYETDAPDVPNMQGMTNEVRPFMSHVFEMGAVVPAGWVSGESNAANTVWTFHMREGMKWSDGELYTADDLMFWFYDLQMNEEYLTGIGAAGPTALADVAAKLEKIDDYTLRFTLKDPNPTYINMMAERSEREILNTAEHYLKQFHPKYAVKAELDAKVKAAGMETWTQLLHWSRDRTGNTNPANPSLLPWTPLDPPPANPAVWTANPYYWVVDELGQQLPYVEQQRITKAADRDTMTLRALQGMVTNTTLPLGSLTLAKEAKAQGKIDFGLFKRGDAYKAETVLLNMNTKNEFHASLFQDVRFRQAFSLFVPRDKVNEIIYQGACVPTLGGFVLSGPSHPWYEPALINSEFIARDIDRANRLLDEILPTKDKDGYRLGPDGKPVFLPVISYSQWMDEQANMLVEDLPLIGLQGTFRSIAWGASGDLTRSGEWDVFYYQSSEAWENQLPERQNLAAPTGRFGENWAFTWWQWLDSGGAEGEEPPKEIKDNYAIYTQMLQEADKAKLADLTKQWYRAQAEQIWTIPIVAFPPNFSVVKPNVGNWNQTTGRIYPSALFYKGDEL